MKFICHEAGSRSRWTRVGTACPISGHALPVLPRPRGHGAGHSCSTIVELRQINSVKYVPSDGFFDIQILQNSISAGAPPRTPLWEIRGLRRFPDPLVGCGGICPHFHLLIDFRVLFSTPLASRLGAFGT